MDSDTTKDVLKTALRQAGGIVTDISGKEIDFDLSAGSMNQNYTILASGNAIHAQLINIINQH